MTETTNFLILLIFGNIVMLLLLIKEVYVFFCFWKKRRAFAGELVRIINKYQTK